MNIYDMRHVIAKIKQRHLESVEKERLSVKQEKRRLEIADEQRRNVLRLRDQGRTLEQIAIKVGISVWQVSKIVPPFVRGPRGPYNPKPRHGIVWPFERSSEMNPLIAAINAAVPKKLREEVRQEICQNLAVAVLSGEVRIEKLKEVV